MAVTGFRRWTLLGSVNIESGTSSDLINAGTGAVTLAVENQSFELSSPKFSSAQADILSLSDEIPQGSKITGIEYIYPLGFSATTFPTSATTRSRLTLSDSNVGSYEIETVTANSPFRLKSVGGDLNLVGTSIKFLGNLTSVGGSLFLEGTSISKKYSRKEIIDMVKVEGDLYL